MAMFRIECLCDEKSLSPILLALAAHKAKEVVTTVATNVATNADGGVVPRTNGEVTEMFRAWCAEKGLTNINASHARQFQVDHGRSPNGYSNVLLKSLKAGVLKRPRGAKTSKGGYDVIAKS